jgi:hypothetical protein
MSHYMMRWQFPAASAKALVGKPHDRTGAASPGRSCHGPEDILLSNELQCVTD